MSVLGLHSITDQSAAPHIPAPRPALHRVARLTPVPADSNAPRPADPSAAAGTPKRGQVPWISILLVFVFAAGLTFAAVYVNALRSGTGLAVPRFVQAIFPRPGLGLRVEYEGEHLLITWDRRSATVRSAVTGVLRIDDGGQRRDVHLDATQVAAGSILYRPASDDVTFRLELRSDQGTATAESLRVLNSRKPPTISAPASNAPSNPPTSSQPRSLLDRTPASKVAAAPESAHLEALPVEPVHRRPAPDVTSEPPARAPSYVPTVSTPPSAPLTGVGPSTSSPPGTPEMSLDTARQPTPDQVAPATQFKRAKALPTLVPANKPAIGMADGKTLSMFKPARPLRQVMPNASVFASAIFKPTRVEVRVTIDSTGHVKSARIVSGETKVKTGLAEVALIAARQWLFEPATVHGTPVESEHSIVFAFQPP